MQLYCKKKLCLLPYLLIFCIFNCCLGVDSFCKSIFSFVSCSSFRPAYSNADWMLLFSHSVASNSLQPHGLQHARLSCPSPTPRACSNSCPLSQWCHPTISSSVVPFSSCLQSFPASGSFPVSQHFISGGQSIGVSASASVLPMNIQDWFPWGWTGLISLQCKGLKNLLQHHSSKASILWCSAFFMIEFSYSIHDYWKNHTFD